MPSKKPSRKLEKEYRAMSNDKEREAEALEWIDGILFEPVDNSDVENIKVQAPCASKLKISHEPLHRPQGQV